MTDSIEIDLARDSSPEECAVCDGVLAVVGLVIAGIFLYISVDVLLKGRLTSAISRGVVNG